ncbi:hypothetical protein GYH30_029787 [Glycine max]|uniref:Uncharacterized protein n=2 Tax=Glycine subgen. Soja TaxID=1462606 RepID=A0A0R0HAQ6_SOYBN|nr:hypothetical protein GYH30_029787 [Glycine max]RZB77923.1 hypothetical protein D0Y65_028745 [Glycine soja]
MRGPFALALLPAKCRFWQIYSIDGSHIHIHGGETCKCLLATLTPKKQEKNEADETGLATKEMIDPIVVYSRLPPLIGPLLCSLVVRNMVEPWL